MCLPVSFTDEDMLCVTADTSFFDLLHKFSQSEVGSDGFTEERPIIRTSCFLLSTCQDYNSDLQTHRLHITVAITGLRGRQTGPAETNHPPSNRHPTGDLLSDVVELRRRTQHIIVLHHARLLICERDTTPLKDLHMYDAVSDTDVNQCWCL